MTITITVSNNVVRPRILGSSYVTDVEVNLGILIRTQYDHRAMAESVINQLVIELESKGSLQLISAVVAKMARDIFGKLLFDAHYKDGHVVDSYGCKWIEEAVVEIVYAAKGASIGNLQACKWAKRIVDVQERWFENGRWFRAYYDDIPMSRSSFKSSESVVESVLDSTLGAWREVAATQEVALAPKC